MLIMVYGGSGSGKSEYAENIAVMEAGTSSFQTRPKSDLYYIATMQPYDKEVLKKIDRHRQMRSSKNFKTIECFTNIAAVQVNVGGTVLLECMSNLVANEIFGDSGAREDTYQVVKKGIISLKGLSENLIIVTNNIFEDGTVYDSQMQFYLETLSKINRYISSMADKVTEVVHGIPLTIK